MSNEVVIKSNRSGLRLILDNETPFPELLKIIGEEFRQRESFFKNASMAISFEGKELSVEEEKKIMDVITENSSIQIVCIMDKDSDMEERMRLQAEAVRDYVLQENLAVLESMGGPADFYTGNLRSGQVLESPSSITLIGDVNPGAKIISQGNIVVLGSLRGNAFAGAAGDSSCFIFSLDMSPLQLQIGEYIAKSPDREKRGRRLLKKEKNTASSYTPQVAVIREGNICIEPMTKGCLDR